MPKRAFNSATTMRAVLTIRSRDSRAIAGRGPQHHDRLRRLAAGRRELGEKLGMTGMGESGAVEHALGNRVGDHSSGPSGDDIADRLPNRGDRCIGTGVIGSARQCRRRLAGGDDRQRVREGTERIRRPNIGELDLQSKSPCAFTDGVAIAEQIERGELQLMPA